MVFLSHPQKCFNALTNFKRLYLHLGIAKYGNCLYHLKAEINSI